MSTAEEAYAAAEEAIREAKRTGAKRLDLSAVAFRPLKELPPEIAELTDLRQLHLDQTQIADLAPLRTLFDLESLSFDDTHVDDLSPLQGLGLQMLSLERTQVADLRPIIALHYMMGSLYSREDQRIYVHVGLRFKDCLACRLDPDGLGRLSQIDYHEHGPKEVIRYLQSLTVWPPHDSDPVEAAMDGPILEASIADIARIEAAFEAVSPDPPLPKHRDRDYDELVETLAYAADRLAGPGRADRFGLALIDGFRDYRRRVQQDQPNGRLLNYIADSVRAALADEFLVDALDGLDHGQMTGFLRNHDTFIRAYFPRALRPVTPEPDLPAETLMADLPPKVAEAEAIIEDGIARGTFGDSMRAPLAYLKARMQAAIQTLATADEPARLAGALSDLRKTATLVTAYVGRIKGRLIQYARESGEWASGNPATATATAVTLIIGVPPLLAKLGPLFGSLWRMIGSLPLPF